MTRLPAGALIVLLALGRIQPPDVVVDNSVITDVTDYEDFTGRTEALESVEFRARIKSLSQNPGCRM